MKMIVNTIFVFFTLFILVIPQYYSQNNAITFREPFRIPSFYYFIRGISNSETGVSDRLYVRYNNNLTNEWKWEDVGKPARHNLVGKPGVVSFLANDQKERVYAFFQGEDNQLHEAYKIGNSWRWTTHGKPSGVNVMTSPSVITYKDNNNVRHIYVFFIGENGHLYTRYWNGTGWYWADRGKPNQTDLAPWYVSAITYQDLSGVQKIYVFARGSDGNLYVNFRSINGWNWADQQSTVISANILALDAITYRDKNNAQHIRAFGWDVSGRLVSNYWNGRRWSWTIHSSLPNSARITSPPSVITYRDSNGEQITYVIVNTTGGKLFANIWEGNRSRWEDLGSVSVDHKWTSFPSAITYREGSNLQKINVFVRSEDGIFYSKEWDGRYWSNRSQGTPEDLGEYNSQNTTSTLLGDGSQGIHDFFSHNGNIIVNSYNGSRWTWNNQGRPGGTTPVGEPGVISYKFGFSGHKVYAFVTGLNGNLHVNYFNGSRWAWADQGRPNGMYVESSPSTITYYDRNIEKRLIHSYVIGRDDKLYMNYWDGSQWRWEDLGKPNHTNLVFQPEAISYPLYMKGRVRAVYAVGRDKQLYQYIWNSNSNYSSWRSLGKPGTIDINSSPSHVSFFHEGIVHSQRDFTFVRGSNDQLYCHSSFPVGFGFENNRWANFGKPNNVRVTGRPSAITYKDKNFIQRIYAFMIGEDGNLYTRYWDGFIWRWANLKKPNNGRLAVGTDTKAIAFSDPEQEDYIQVFVEGVNNERYLLEWNGRSWKWHDQDFRSFTNAGRSIMAPALEKDSSANHIIYPNPFYDYISIKNPEDIKRITLISENGVAIKPETELRDGEMRIDLSLMKGRSFTIQIETNEGIETKKILKTSN